jgi:hypothetical protein
VEDVAGCRCVALDDDANAVITTIKMKLANSSSHTRAVIIAWLMHGNW